MRKSAYVSRVIDGDTFEISSDRVKLAEVNAPELGTPAGEKAKKKLEELILNKYVDYEVVARDEYGRRFMKIRLLKL